MKKILFSSVAAFFKLTLLAQPPHPDAPPKPPPISDRWKHDSTKLQLYVVLNASQLASVKNTFVSFYNEMDALMPSPQNTPPAPPSREAVEKMRSKRKVALKALLNAEQFDRFNVFEKEFMPPMPHPPKPQGEAEKF